jgi:general secretion pathway protein I
MTPPSTAATNPKAGFTLIEALVAFTILALAMGALLQGFATGLRSLGTAEAYAIAAMQVRSKLAELGHLEPLEEGVEEGEFDNGSAWRVTVEPYEAETSTGERLGGNRLIYRVEATVTWQGEREVSLTTLRLGPKE